MLSVVTRRVHKIYQNWGSEGCESPWGILPPGAAASTYTCQASTLLSPAHKGGFSKKIMCFYFMCMYVSEYMYVNHIQRPVESLASPGARVTGVQCGCSASSLHPL